MLLAATAPEYILWNSANDFYQARKTVQYLTAKQTQQQNQQKWTMTHMLFACADGFRIRTLEGSISKCSLQKLQGMISKGAIEDPPILEEELKGRSKADWTVKIIAILQILWFLIQTLIRTIQHYHITALEMLTVAFIICSMFIYGFSFQKPQDVEFPIFLEVHDTLRDPSQITPSRKVIARSHHAVTQRVTFDDSDVPLHNISNANSQNSREERQEEEEEEEEGEAKARPHWRLLAILGCVFGAIHCLAWNSQFPTSSERLAWRICAVVITTMPGLMAIALHWFGLVVVITSIFCDAGNFFAYVVVPRLQPLALLIYTIGRITIVILAFIGLRALPADAFQTVD